MITVKYMIEMVSTEYSGTSTNGYLSTVATLSCPGEHTMTLV